MRLLTYREAWRAPCPISSSPSVALSAPPRATGLGEDVSGLVRKCGPLLLVYPGFDRGRDVRRSPAPRVDGSALERYHRMPRALGEAAQRLAIHLEVGRRVDGKMTNRKPLGARHCRPAQKRKLEPGEIELAPHRERDGGERLVHVPFESESQVHRQLPAGAGVSTITSTCGLTRSAPSMTLYGFIPKLRRSTSMRATALPSFRWTSKVPSRATPWMVRVPRTLHPPSVSFTSLETKVASGCLCASSTSRAQLRSISALSRSERVPSAGIPARIAPTTRSAEASTRAVTESARTSMSNREARRRRSWPSAE